MEQKDDKYNRIGQILLVQKAPKIFLEKGKSTSAGKHGYNPRKTPEMKAVFTLGKFFKNQTEIDEFQNVSVYPLVAEILGLKFQNLLMENFQRLKSFEIDYSGIQTLTFPCRNSKISPTIFINLNCMFKSS